MSSTPRMEQVFFHTHSKISQSILRHSSHRFRSTIEHFVLGLAVCGFCVVLLGHVTFVHRGDLFRGMAVAVADDDDDECSIMRSDNVGMICEVNGGVSVYSLLVQLLRSGYITWLLPYSVMQRDLNSDHVVGKNNIYMPTKKQIPTSCLRNIPGFSEDADVTHILLQMENKDRLLDQNSNSGSRAFTLHSSGREQSEWIVTGMHPLSSSVTQQHLKCAVIQKRPTTAEEITKRRERRGGEKIPECPTEITALLSEYGYHSMANNITNNQSTFKQPRLIYSYSHAQGLLILSPKLKQEHNISTQFVIASSSDDNCFGEPFIQSIVFSLAGPDTVILNWILGLQQHISRRSNDDDNHHKKRIQFVHHWKTSKEIDLDLFDMDHYAFSSSRGGSSSKYYAIGFLSSYPFLGNIVVEMRHNPLYRLVRFLMFKLAVFLSTLFIFFLTTSLVSFTFQETQDRMLEFTLQLQTHVRARLPLGGLIVRHILENVVFVPVMVGMIFFLIEFYEGDKFLAFMVLTIVWIAEVFSAVSIRSIQGMFFFPRVFFLYFTLFHVYFFSCPIGFTYASLGSTSLFLIHAMLFFLNRYELPAVHSGLVTAEIPRMIRNRNTGGTQTANNQLRQSPRSDLPQVPNLRSHDNHPNLVPTPTQPLERRATLPQNTMRSYVIAASTSLQSIRSLASMQSLQSLADRASPNWLYASGSPDGEGDEDDSFMAYVGDETRSSLSMSVDNR